MYKLHFFFLVCLVSQIIAIFMWGEYVWLQKYSHGGVGGTVIEQINPVFWLLLIIEFIIFVILVIKRKI